MLSCICGGFELLFIIPVVGWFIHLFRRKCCKKSCECDCHDPKVKE